jgi:hypothetical protein
MEGKWIITQQWNGVPAYKFEATFSADGTITVNGGYFGAWCQLGSSNQVSLAVANFGDDSVSSYSGNIVGPAMGGLVVGRSKQGTISKGSWSAAQEAHSNAAPGMLTLPGKS